MRSVWVKQFILPFLKDGRKSLEIRVATSFFLSVKVGEILYFNNSVPKRVVAIRRYSNLKHMLEHEDPARILPGWGKTQLTEALERVLRQEQQGILVFELTDPD